jgi:predicted RNA binding protein YcfA (HicA-like mRNA interferase family)/predicted RNase H-like HicB family nuclease
MFPMKGVSMQRQLFAYTVIYEEDPETHSICASVPALDLATYGESIEEARCRMREALELHLEGMLEELLPIAPDILQSERLTVEVGIPCFAGGSDMRASEVIRILLHNGFIERKSRGGHRQFVRSIPAPKRLATVPYHTGDVPKPVLRRIATQSGKSPDEFR